MTEKRLLRLALPFTILPSPGQVRLVAGEDARYTLRAPAIEEWLPPLLRSLPSIEAALERTKPEWRAEARAAIERLVSERVLVEPSALEVHAPAELELFRQDRLDWNEALALNRAARAKGKPWVWVSTGALARGYVSPVFLRDAGPCLECLVRGFQRLSPFPELYDEVLAYARSGGAVEPGGFPGERILDEIVAWKRAELAKPEPSPALYRLHVLERDDLTVTTHRVLRDPACPACS